VRCFLIYIPHHPPRDDPIREDGMGGNEHVWGSVDVHIAFCWGNPEEQDNLEGLDIDGKISERTLKK